MRAFWTDAENIFETASQAAQSGSPDCDWAILIGPRGGIQMVEATGWAMPSLLAQHGAETAYRVTREYGHVRLEGRCGAETCLFRSESPAVTARHLLAPLSLPPATWNPPSPALLAEQAPAWPTKEIWKMFA